MTDGTEPLMVTSREARELARLLRRRVVGGGGIEVVDKGDTVSVSMMSGLLAAVRQRHRLVPVVVKYESGTTGSAVAPCTFRYTIFRWGITDLNGTIGKLAEQLEPTFRPTEKGRYEPAPDGSTGIAVYHFEEDEWELLAVDEELLTTVCDTSNGL